MRPEAVSRLMAAQSARKTQVRSQVLARVQDLVSEFSAWYDTAAITALTERIVSLVEPGQAQTARITDAYLSQLAREMVGMPVDPTGIVDVAALRQGITHQGVYGRLADQYRYMASQGTPEAQIIAALINRAHTLVVTDLQLANTHQSRTWMTARNWDRWRRVIRPESSRTGVCGLCLVASDRVYTYPDLLPIHDRCNCDVILIAAGADPGRFLNNEDLDRIYAVSGSTYAEDLLSTNWRVDEHGEIGPVLVNPDHNHRGPDDLPSAA